MFPVSDLLSSPLPDDADFRYQARMMDIMRLARLDQGISKSQLCRSAKVANGTVGRAERYDRFPTIPVLRKIVHALELNWVAVCKKAELPTDSHPL
jgi:transcriptional regulator with XRE-family HTH domain